MVLQSVDNLFKQFENLLNEAKNNGEAYIMVFKPYVRKIIINPVVFKQGTNIYVTNSDCSFIVNVFNFDTITVGVTDNDFYNKYGHNDNIIR